MRVVVATIVHHPADARIYHRQIRALLDAGHEVRYIAPAGSPDFGTERAGSALRHTAIPRARGRRRAGAIFAARSALKRHAAGADLMLIHDPELLLALPPRRRRPPVIWDVHEDTVAALSTKPWLPPPFRPPAALAVHAAERMAERYVHLILAEHGYVARFARPHPVVSNTTYVPDIPAPPGDDRRVVYVGHLSPDRGSAEPFGDVSAAADAVLELDGNISLRMTMSRRGHQAAYSSLGWPSDAREFVAQLELWAKSQTVDVRSEGLPVLVLFPFVLLLRSLRKDGAWAWRNAPGWLAAAVMAVGCAVLVVAYAAWFHSWYGSYTLSRSDGFYLWGRMSSFAECSVIKPPADELTICPSGRPSSRTPPGDYIWHAPQMHDIAGGPVSVANDALLRDFAIRAVEAEPFGYLHAVLDGLALTVEWPRHKYPDPGTVHYYYFQFQLTPQTIPADHSWIPGGTAYSDAVRYGHAVRPAERIFADSWS